MILRKLLTSSFRSITGVRSRFLSMRQERIREHDQIHHLKLLFESDDNPLINWEKLKHDLLTKRGVMTIENIDSVVLKVLMNMKKYDSCLSFTSYILENQRDLTLGKVNVILRFYHFLSQDRKLTTDQVNFIKQAYKDLYSKYKVLNISSCENLALALCSIDEVEDSLKVLNELEPEEITASIYGKLVATLFRNSRKELGLELLQKMMLYHVNAEPNNDVFLEWIKMVKKSSSNEDTLLLNFEEILRFWETNSIVISESVAEEIKNSYAKLKWRTYYSSVDFESSECNKCKQHLEQKPISTEEFTLLQQNVRQKLIVGSDLFLKSSPDELSLFQKYLKATQPCDIVLDALNISYACGDAQPKLKLDFLLEVVKEFQKQGMKIMVLGRQHMLRWPKPGIQYLRRNTFPFFTSDLSQDDPYFITAALMSGPHTDLVSKDLLRGHKYLLGDKNLKNIFQRWQWEHQWSVKSYRKRPVIEKPLSYTPFAQKQKGWHIPFERPSPKYGEHTLATSRGWLCLQPTS